MSAHALDPAFAVAARQVEDGTVPFVILGVAGADGVARLDAFPPVEGPRIGTNAVCLLASITKPIVATAVMRLAQDGRFPLTAPLSRWLPELDAAGLAPFTAWHVLTHTTGIARHRPRAAAPGRWRPAGAASGGRSPPGRSRCPGAGSATRRSPSTCWPRPWSAPWTGRSRQCCARRCWIRSGWPTRPSTPAPSGDRRATGRRRRLGRDASGAAGRRRHGAHGRRLRLAATGGRRAVEHGP